MTYVDICSLSLDIPANPSQQYVWHFTVQGFKAAVIASPGGNLVLVPAEGDVRSKHYASSILICVFLSSAILWTYSLDKERSSRIFECDKSQLPDRSATSARLGQVARPSLKHSKMLLLVKFEPKPPQPGKPAEFVGRADGATVMLTRDGMDFASAPQSSKRSSKPISVRFLDARRHGSASTGLNWRGAGKLAGETNYFLGNDPAKWRTHVPHFSRAAAMNVIPGVDAVAYAAGWDDCAVSEDIQHRREWEHERFCCGHRAASQRHDGADLLHLSGWLAVRRGTGDFFPRRIKFL